MKYRVRMATADEVHELEFRDYSAITAIFTCPTWGVIRYALQRRPKGMGREMPLEAGHAMHEVFAATRVWNLINQQDKRVRGRAAMLRMWGEDKTADMLNMIGDGSTAARHQFVNHALYTSGFYDNPYDKRRTMTNLETATHLYVRMAEKQNPVWFDPVRPSVVGIEQPFHCVLETLGRYPKRYGFYGKIDGIEQTKKSVVKLAENKTTYRIDDPFRYSFDTTHQITGYMAAARALYGVEIEDANVYALSIPLPKSHVEGYARIPVKRTPDQFDEWAYWFIEGTKLYDKYAGINGAKRAPMYTHSCSRFFRSCSLLPLCATPKKEWKAFFKETMMEHKWDPTQEQEEIAGS